MQDILEGISELSEILQSYESRGCSAAEASLSDICDRRQDEVEMAINAATSRLQVGWGGFRPN